MFRFLRADAERRQREYEEKFETWERKYGLDPDPEEPPPDPPAPTLDRLVPKPELGNAVLMQLAGGDIKRYRKIRDKQRYVDAWLEHAHEMALVYSQRR